MKYLLIISSLVFYEYNSKMPNMAIRVMGFSKLGRFMPKNHTQRKSLNFENWINGEVSKIWHHFRKQGELKIGVIKKCK